MVNDVVGGGGYQHFRAWRQERFNALPGVGHDAAAAPRGFEYTRWRTVASRCHVGAIDVEHHARGAVPGAVLTGGHVPNVANVVRHCHVTPAIAAQHEALLRRQRSRPKEQVTYTLLPIRHAIAH